MTEPEISLVIDSLMRRYHLSSHQLLLEPATLIDELLIIAAEEAKQEKRLREKAQDAR